MPSEVRCAESAPGSPDIAIMADDSKAEESSVPKQSSHFQKHHYGASLRNVHDKEVEKDPEVENNKKFIDCFGRIIPFLYGAFALAILGMYIAGFITEHLKDMMIWCILGTSLTSSVLGAWAVYKYGVIQDQIDRLKEENGKYEREINELGATRQKLGKEVDDLQDTVKNLEHDAHELDEEAKEFEGLVEELKGIAGENEEVLNLLNNTNQIFSDMRKVVLENERAHLLSTFYECAFRDDDNKMSEDEWQRFIGRLSTKQRAKFKRFDFKAIAGDDGCLDLQEFQEVLEQVLEEVDDLLRDEFSKS